MTNNVPLKPFAYHIITHDGLEFLSMSECKLPNHISTPLYSPSQLERVRNSWTKLLNSYTDKLVEANKTIERYQSGKVINNLHKELAELQWRMEGLEK